MWYYKTMPERENSKNKNPVCCVQALRSLNFSPKGKIQLMQPESRHTGFYFISKEKQNQLRPSKASPKKERLILLLKKDQLKPPKSLSKKIA